MASLQAHHHYLEGLAGHYPPPRDLIEMILAGGGKAMGVEHAVLFEVYDI